VCDPTADDNRVLLPDPGYPGYWRGAVLSGMQPVAMPLSADCRLRPWELPEATLRGARLMWLNSPHNPTGSVMTRDELRRTWEVCQRHDILLVNDECYADIYRAQPPPGLLEVATDGVLVVHSLSKRSGMTGYCSAAVVGDPTWVAALDKLRSNLANGPQDFVNAAACAAWADDAHVAARRAVLGGRVERMRAFLVGVGHEVVGSEAALYLWVRAPRGLTGEQWAQQLLGHGIVVAPGSFFGHTDAGRDFVRLAVCGDDDELEAAMVHWRAAVEDGHG
jgi:acetylornithine aminotransferase